MYQYKTNIIVLYFQPNDSTSHGVCHGDDMFYLFSSSLPHLKRIGKATPQDEMVRKKMIQLWMNFVQHSNPTPNPGKPSTHYSRNS